MAGAPARWRLRAWGATLSVGTARLAMHLAVVDLAVVDWAVVDLAVDDGPPSLGIGP